MYATKDSLSFVDVQRMMRYNVLRKNEFISIMKKIGFRDMNPGLVSTTTACTTDHDAAARNIVAQTSESFHTVVKTYVEEVMRAVLACFGQENRIFLQDLDGQGEARSLSSSSSSSSSTPPPGVHASEIAFFQSIGMDTIPDCATPLHRGSSGIVFDVGNRVVKISPITAKPSSVDGRYVRDVLDLMDPRALRRLISNAQTLPAFTESICACALTEFCHAQLTPAVTPAYACVMMNARPMCTGIVEEGSSAVPALAILMDRNDLSLYQILTESFAQGRYDVVHSCLVQVVAALGCLQSVAEFAHNDLHPKNVMAVRVGERSSVVYAHPGGSDFVVPTHGYLLRIIDFGKSRMTMNSKAFCSSDSLFADPSASWCPHTCWYDLLVLGTHVMTCMLEKGGGGPHDGELVERVMALPPESSVGMVLSELEKLGMHSPGVVDGQVLWKARVLALLKRFLTVTRKRGGTAVNLFELCASYSSSSSSSSGGGGGGAGLVKGSLANRMLVSAVACAMTNVFDFVSEGPAALLRNVEDCVLEPYRSGTGERGCADILGCVFPLLWNSRPFFDTVDPRHLTDNFYVRTMGWTRNVERRKATEAVVYILNATTAIKALVEDRDSCSVISSCSSSPMGKDTPSTDDDGEEIEVPTSSTVNPRPSSNPYARKNRLSHTAKEIPTR